MMDFLRRLAPPRETDASRAVAVLPSRFASESSLRVTIGHARPAQRPDDDEASLSLDATSASAATNVMAAQRHPITSVQPSQAVPRPLGSGPTRRDNGKATSSTHAPAKAPDIDVADPRALQDRQGANPERARPAGPELLGPTTALEASHGTQGVAAAPAQPRVAPPAQPRVALPLSQAILAQRTLQSRDDGQVVHVTIGRIDVVANAAPAPAVRRCPTRRQGTVTLADYLRGGNGSRR